MSCPYCHTFRHVKELEVKQDGGWYMCQRCNERFFVSTWYPSERKRCKSCEREGVDVISTSFITGRVRYQCPRCSYSWDENLEYP